MSFKEEEEDEAKVTSCSYYGCTLPQKHENRFCGARASPRLRSTKSFNLLLELVSDQFRFCNTSYTVFQQVPDECSVLLITKRVTKEMVKNFCNVQKDNYVRTCSNLTGLNLRILRKCNYYRLRCENIGKTFVQEKAQQFDISFDRI